MNVATAKVHHSTIDIETLQGLEPIASLSSHRIKELASQIYIEKAAAGTVIFKEAERDKKLIYLLSGEIELRSSLTNSKSTITAGLPESWHPIANKQPRQLLAAAISDIEIIRIDMDQFDQMLTWDQMAVAEPEDANDKVVLTSLGDWRTKLRNTLALNNIPPANIEKLFARMDSINVKENDVIIKQDEPGDYFYLIDKGRAKVTRQMMGKGNPVALAELAEGISFGEEALISDKPRNANVIMITNGRLMRLSKADFVELLKEPLLDQIDLDSALDMLDDGAVLLDVRVASEYEQGHLPNAVNIPLNEIRKKLNTLDQATIYVCYCSTGRRSSAASFILKQQQIKSSFLTEGLQTVPSAYLIK